VSISQLVVHDQEQPLSEVNNNKHLRIFNNFPHLTVLLKSQLSLNKPIKQNKTKQKLLPRHTTFVQAFSSTKCNKLTTVAPFFTAHTFLVSRDGLRNLGFLRTVPAKYKGILCSLWLCGKSRSEQGLSECQNKIGRNLSFFRDNRD